jgi:phosphodiesterase/alkaline phosphatase D-like protein
MLRLNLSKHLLVGLIFLFCLSGASVARAQVPEFTPLTFDPPAVYLTWQRDPSTTMTVCWQTLTSMQRVPRLEVQKTNETVWRAFYGVNSPMPHSDRVTHRVQVENLAPATEYRFRFGPDSRSFTFRTMPARAERPIRFATGGDTMHEKRWWRTPIVRP